jgi:hypothetical protein
MTYTFKLAQARVRHRLRFARQIFAPPSIALAGAYHYENLGDMALAATGSVLWPGPKRPALQTTANIEKWPGRPLTLICGGAIVNDELVVKLRSRFGEYPINLGLIGVELTKFGTPLSRDSAEFLAALPFFAVRNRSQSDLFERHGIRAAPLVIPDVVFGAPFDVPTSGKDAHPVLGINATRGLGKETPVSNNQRRVINEVRRLFFRTAVKQAIKRGWRVEHVPFAISDDLCGRTLLDGLPVHFLSYDPDPARVYARVARMAGFVATRYHALIFALRAGVPVIPFHYASKNYWLAEDFMIDLEPFGIREAITGPTPAEVRQRAERFYTLPAPQRDALSGQVRKAFGTAFSTLGQAEDETP